MTAGSWSDGHWSAASSQAAGEGAALDVGANVTPSEANSLKMLNSTLQPGIKVKFCQISLLFDANKHRPKLLFRTSTIKIIILRGSTKLN
jgi:hypothetical protein